MKGMGVVLDIEDRNRIFERGYNTDEEGALHWSSPS